MFIGNCLAVQWLGQHAFTAVGQDSIPGQETKIPQATRCSQKKKKEKEMFIGIGKQVEGRTLLTEKRETNEMSPLTA